MERDLPEVRPLTDWNGNPGEGDHWMANRGEGLLQHRDAVDWKEARRLWYPYFGGVGILATLASVLVRDLPSSRALILVLLAVILLSGFAVSAWLSRLPESQTWAVPGTHNSLKLRVGQGDLFDHSTPTTSTAITMNRHFGLTMPDVVEGSLVSQLARLAGGVETLKASDAGAFDLDHPEPPGSVRPLSVEGRQFLLVAAATVPQAGDELTRLPLRDILTALEGIWAWMRANKRDIRMPVLGSGNSGSHVAHETLLAVIALSLLGHQQESPPPIRPTQVEIVVSRDDWTYQALKRLRRLLAEMGFTTI